MNNNILTILLNKKTINYLDFLDVNLILKKLEIYKPQTQVFYLKQIYYFMKQSKYIDIIKKYNFVMNKICYIHNLNKKIKDYDYIDISKDDIINKINNLKLHIDILNILNKDELNNIEYKLLKQFILLNLFIEHQIKNIQIINIKLLNINKFDNQLIKKNNIYHIILNDKCNLKYFNGVELILSKNLTKYIDKLINSNINLEYLFLKKDKYTKCKTKDINYLYYNLFKKYKKINYYNILYNIWTTS
jgi:hypothetical protein